MTAVKCTNLIENVATANYKLYVFTYSFILTNGCYIVMYVQINQSIFAINQCSVRDRLDQMIVGQLSNEHWRNGSWVSKYRQIPCKLKFKFCIQIYNILYTFNFDQLIDK